MPRRCDYAGAVGVLLGSGRVPATVKRLKSLLSGTFTHAVNLGYLNGVNPVVGAMLPAAAPPKETAAYSLEQIRAMIAALTDQTSPRHGRGCRVYRVVAFRDSRFNVGSMAGR